MFESTDSKSATLTPAIEEGVNRRKRDAADRNLILHEFKKHINPFVDLSLELINIVNRKVDDDSINVADTVNIGEEITRNFVNSLPECFHKAISGEIKTMDTMKRGIKVGGAMIYDMEALFNRLVIVGQNRNTSLVSVFEYEICAVPSSILDEFGLYCEKNWPSFQLSPVLQMK